MAHKFPRLIVQDLLASQPSFKLHDRSIEVERMFSVLQRKQHHNILVTGQRGSGKSALLEQFMSESVPLKVPYLKLDTHQLTSLLHSAAHIEAVLEYLSEAFATLPSSVVILDNAEKVLSELESSWEAEQLFKTFSNSSKARIVLAIASEHLAELQEIMPALQTSFETIVVPEVSKETCRKIVFDHAARLSAVYNVKMTREAVGAVMEYANQFTSTYAQPEHVLRFFEEVCAGVASRHKKVLEHHDVRSLFSQRVGLPVVESTAKRNQLNSLTERLRKRVHGQDHAVSAVSKTISAAWLGLKSPTKPMGSFLFLGPSGVGKTELAKAVAHEAYGDERAVLRLDMSEFAEPHTAQRLLGAPPGYVGYEAGGQLTDFVRQKPFSLVLLDEIEKAHLSLFDIFLQVLDDGRLTDGQGRTVDFTKTIIIATSNIGAIHIVEQAVQGSDVTDADWQQRQMLPLLLQRFRPEFINRFSGVVVFKPFSTADLISIARLEIKKFEERFKDRNISIAVSDEWLQQVVTKVSNPLFGARPLKRFIEEACEQMMMQELLNKTPV